MKRMIALTAVLAAAPANAAAQYDCLLDSRTATSLQQGAFTSTDLNFPGMPEDAWRYRISLNFESEDAKMRVESAADPARLVGEHNVLQLRSGVFSAVAVHGDCMFAELTCLDLIQLIDQSEDSAILTITPSAFGSTDTPYADYLNVTLRGRCVREEVGS